MTKHIANIITFCRIVGSIFLLFFPVFSLGFFVTYILCGFTDVIDGKIARKTNSASSFGAKLDTAADFVFVTVSFIKILPKIHIPYWLWIWGGIIAIIKIGNMILGYILQKQFVAIHTIMNKVTGLLLFLLPLTMFWIEFKYSAVVVCAVATFAAIQEAFYIRNGREIV